jgi:hypothetical protein
MSGVNYPVRARVLPHIIIKLLESRHTSSVPDSNPIVPHIFNFTLLRDYVRDWVISPKSALQSKLSMLLEARAEFIGKTDFSFNMSARKLSFRLC